MNNGGATHLDLFSGIGGFAIAARWAGFRTVGFCEWEPYCQKLLKQHWPGVPVHGDIRDLDGTKYKGVSIISGGFPCQPFSQAGKQRGKEDDRYLWPEMLRVIREVGPRWVLGENVAGIVNMALDQVLIDLEAQGYTTGTVIVPACAVDAPHRRDRVWIIAHTTGKRGTRGEGSVEVDGCNSGQEISAPLGESKTLANSSSKRGQIGLPRQKQGEEGDTKKFNHGSNRQHGGKECHDWPIEPGVCRVVDGLPNRAHRLKGLGNAIVPQVAYTIMEAMRQME